jgi:hypothetical protein
MNYLFVLILFWCSLQCSVNSAQILVISSMPAHSHYTLAFRLVKELADRNNQVTFISPYPQKTQAKNYRDISIEETIDFTREFKKTLFELDGMGFIGNKLIDTELGTGLVEHTFKNSEVQKLLNSDESFDVVIIEHFLNEALIGIAHHFNAPVVFLAPVASCAKNNYLFGNPSPSSYVPDLLGSFTKHMNFWQRLENFLVINYNDILREILYIPKQRELFKKYVKTNLELDDLLYNISLMLTTSHPSVTDAVPHLPNIIEIGGYHVSPPKDLPRDLQEYMDNATDGVVLFSMGSNLKSKDLTLDVRRSILGAFSKLKEKVLWKFETDLPEASPNVKVMKWLPQQDILGHPNIKAFITHGGLLSTIEAVYYGVPIIGIPVFGDQRNNMEAAVSNGYGVSVLLQDLTEKTFSGALSEILNNPKYRENVQKRSKLMHDQPLKPIDSAVYWIEHVIRHKGAPHLRSVATELKWYQREMIDIIVFLMAVTSAILVTIFLLLKKCVKLIMYYSKLKKTTSRNKKNK